MKFIDRPFVAPSLLLAVALLAGLAFIGWGISARGQENTISVTGSASVAATADTATWTIDLSDTVYPGDIAAAALRVESDANTVAAYLNDQKFASSSVTIATVSESGNYASDGTLATYDVSDTVTVSTSDVHAIDSLAHNIGVLDASVNDGTIVSPEQPQYYVSNLPALRVSLLGAAIKDAKARATQIAENGGSSVGALETASSGVVQVLPPDSSNSEDDGQYDTSTIQKEVTETVRADFYVK